MLDKGSIPMLDIGAIFPRYTTDKAANSKNNSFLYFLSFKLYLKLPINNLSPIIVINFVY